MSFDSAHKVNEYYSIKPSRFRILRSVALTQAVNPSSGEMQQQVSLLLAQNDGFIGEMLSIELLDVRNLNVQQPHWSLITLSNMEITQAPPTGKYDRRYVVLDAEEGVISCSCEDFYVAVVNSPGGTKGTF